MIRSYYENKYPVFTKVATDTIPDAAALDLTAPLKSVTCRPRMGLLNHVIWKTRRRREAKIISSPSTNNSTAGCTTPEK
jgi:hypothetical protein